MPDGLSLLDLADLPASWRALMRLIMREKSMLYSALVVAVGQLPDDQRLTEAELNDTLGELCRQGYLEQELTDAGRRYSILVARKPGKTLNQTIWSALGVEAPDDAPLRRGGSRTLSSALWDTLDKPADKPSTLSPPNAESAAAADSPAQDDTPPVEPAPSPRRERKNLWDSLG